MITVTSVDSIIENMLNGIEYDKDSKAGRLYPFKVRVGCVQRRPPRHEFFECILDMGRLDVEKTLTGKSFEGKDELTLIFPERWLGVAEQQAFMRKLKEHPEANLLKRVDIITSSPMIIGNFYKEQILILKWEDDNEYQ